MYVTAGTCGYSPKKIAGYDDVGASAADSLRRVWRNAARTICAQPAAYALQAKSALDFLRVRAVVRGFQRQLSNVFLKGLICAGTVVASECLA